MSEIWEPETPGLENYSTELWESAKLKLEVKEPLNAAEAACVDYVFREVNRRPAARAREIIEEKIQTLEANLVLLSGKRLFDVTLTRDQLTGLLGEMGTGDRITFVAEGTPRNNLRF